MLCMRLRGQLAATLYTSPAAGAPAALLLLLLLLLPTAPVYTVRGEEAEEMGVLGGSSRAGAPLGLAVPGAAARALAP